MTDTITDRPLLSVVIPTFKRAGDLDRAIRSVLAEPGDYFEIVIGDDGSPDETPRIVATHAGDPRVRAYRNEINLGMQENVLKVVREARGRYVFILTDDDVLKPGALAKVAEATRSHPDAGYLLSHLATVDERTHALADVHRTFVVDTVTAAGIDAVSCVVGSAWVLSRQVLKRDCIDWDTWDRFRGNIFFPIIVAGRLLLQYPAFYMADFLVEHTWFNEVHWGAFGPDRLTIELRLAADRTRCMAAILHDQATLPAAQAAMERWESGNFRSYLYLPVRGYHDLIQELGEREARRALEEAFVMTPARRRELARYRLRSPLVRMWFRGRQWLKASAPGLAALVRGWRTRSYP
jgi:glycosyltransferase involved in cell wall biosynthesis